MGCSYVVKDKREVLAVSKDVVEEIVRKLAVKDVEKG